MINITYAITVCNELEEITKLVDFLKDKIEKEDEILIQYDEDSASDAIKNYLKIISQLHNTNIKVIGFPLNNDFASYKNNLKTHAKGIFIFQIDADETPSEYLMENIHEFIEYNKDKEFEKLVVSRLIPGMANKATDIWEIQELLRLFKYLLDNEVIRPEILHNYFNKIELLTHFDKPLEEEYNKFWQRAEKIEGFLR